MTNLIDYHIPEAIQIRVTKCGQEPPVNELLIEVGEDVANSNSLNGTSSSNNNKICNFCVDPQITDYQILQSLVVRAFNLQCDFALYYQDQRTKKSNLISSDDDLHQAFRSSSRPFLDITLNVIDYSSAFANITSDWQLSKNIHKYRSILSEWDVVTNSDIILAQTINKTNNFIVKQLEKIKEKAISTTNNSWYLAETIYQYIIAEDKRELEPIDDITFRSFQDSEGRILSQRDLRIAVYRRGVQPSGRRVIWKHLLNVYPPDYTGQRRIDFMRLRCDTYRQMRDIWQMYSKIDPEVIKLVNMVRKDTLRTDRHHPFYANCKAEPEEDDNPNVTSLFNILITYSLNHQVRYCQGMSDLASPLLYVMKDEAHAYVAFCALMHRLGENFSLDGQAISRKFEHLTALLKHYDPEFYRYLYDKGAHELLFCYRWMLLDLKREFPFEETLEMLEVLWASIPPNSNAYKNLFDEGFLYTPQQNLNEAVKLDATVTIPPSLLKLVEKIEMAENKLKQAEKAVVKEERVDKPKVNTARTTTKPANRQLKSIKFLSTDSQVLDSPTEKDIDVAEFLNRPSVSTPEEEPESNGLVNPWDSPDLSLRKKAFIYEHPSLGSSKFESMSSEYFDATAHNGDVLGEPDDVFAEAGKANRSASCSTVDSGIHRSNTLSSMVQVSNESFPSMNRTVELINEGDNVKAAEDAARRRQRFHCLNGLRNAHCNGDDFSDDEDGLEYDNSSIDDHGYLTEFECKGSHLSASSVSNTTIQSNGEERRSTKPTMQLALAKTLLTGKSFSVDSLANSSFDGSKQDNKLDVVPQISVDAESPMSEFEVNCASNSFSAKKMAKSVSEEFLNNLENTIGDNMQTLSVSSNNDDANLDNLSSSSTSSLVILSKSSRKASATAKQDDIEWNLPLLSPEELGQNDAFMLFLCVTILLQNRDRIMEMNMDRNDIQMFFDNMIRKHNVRNVLDDARHLFHTYLSQWHK